MQQIQHRHPWSRIYDTFVFEDVLPKGAIFVPKDNPGWTYDAKQPVRRVRRIQIQTGFVFITVTSQVVRHLI
ncbi:hypothetical protein MGH68_11455 [Erysipelothrix sp. D19-032]